MGSLETDVLVTLWAAGEPLTPGEVQEQLGADLAYTTVMTILRRLWQKDLVERVRDGRAYAYSPKLTEADLAATRMHEHLAKVGDREAALSRFVGSLSRKDERHLRALLDRLQ